MTFEHLVGPVPGPRSRAFAALVARYEARGVTYLAEDYPVVWEAADGATVTDVDGNRYLDLTAAFGVASVGHTNARVAAAVAAQSARLLHGMGDVHPPALKAQLLERLAALAPGDVETTFLASAGAEAIEFALKTAVLATGRERVVAFGGAYHGLSLGALAVAGIARFRDPFAALVAPAATFLAYPDARTPLDNALAAARTALAGRDVAALVVEPIQGRGGVIVPPDGFLPGLRALCDAHGTLLVLDEIYTGFARTGTMFACEREAVVPDLLCLGKAIADGVPLSAAMGRRAVTDAWPASTGEALATSTYLGNPLACAAALATLDELARIDAPACARRIGEAIAARGDAWRMRPAVVDVRGRGALWAVEYDDAERANRIVRRALGRGLILLQSGPTGTSITLAPPLVILPEQLDRALALFEAAMEDAGT